MCGCMFHIESVFVYWCACIHTERHAHTRAYMHALSYKNTHNPCATYAPENSDVHTNTG